MSCGSSSGANAVFESCPSSGAFSARGTQRINFCDNVSRTLIPEGSRPVFRRSRGAEFAVAFLRFPFCRAFSTVGTGGGPSSGQCRHSCCTTKGLCLSVQVREVCVTCLFLTCLLPKAVVRRFKFGGRHIFCRTPAPEGSRQAFRLSCGAKAFTAFRLRPSASRLYDPLRSVKPFGIHISRTKTNGCWLQFGSGRFFFEAFCKVRIQQSPDGSCASGLDAYCFIGMDQICS